MVIEKKQLEELVNKILVTKYSAEDARRILEVILFAELSGKKSHGLVRFLSGNTSVMAQNPTGKPEVIRKTKLSALVHGKGNPGMLVGSLAMEEVIRIAIEHDFGIVGTRETFSTSGCLSYYLEKIGKENLIGIIMAESGPSTPPHGGTEPLFGTNPVGFVFPTQNEPLIFDMGTSAISFGEILKAHALGIKLPENSATDKNGSITTDPKEALEGATLPFDNSYKGAGLAMMVEILGGVLPGAGFTGINESTDGWGNIFLAFSPNLLSEIETFKRKTSQLRDRVRNSRTKDAETVRIPGEKTVETRNKNLSSGIIDVDEKLIIELKGYVSKI